MQAFVDRFRYKASKARQAQSRLKMLERMGPLPETINEPEIRFEFPAGKIPAPPMITMDRVDVGYDGRPVLSNLDLRIDPDDRIALLGANGNGKSTLAKLIAGRIEPIKGEVTRARGLKVGFFAQHQIEDLDPEASGVEHLRRRLPNEREERLRATLGRFGLTQEKGLTLAKHLSGGEKTRLCFTLMCLEAPQILILDEPTNHLDIDSREALVAAINEFAGAVIVISHDRHLVELTVDRLWLVKDGRVRPYDGDMESYRTSLLATETPERPRGDDKGRQQRTAGQPRMSAADRRSRLAPLRKAAKEAEREVEKLDRRKRALEAELADPANYGDGERVKALQAEAAALEERIEAAQERWLETEAAIEALEGT